MCLGLGINVICGKDEWLCLWVNSWQCLKGYVLCMCCCGIEWNGVEFWVNVIGYYDFDMCGMLNLLLCDRILFDDIDFVQCIILEICFGLLY